MLQNCEKARRGIRVSCRRRLSTTTWHFDLLRCISGHLLIGFPSQSAPKMSLKLSDFALFLPNRVELEKWKPDT